MVKEIMEVSGLTQLAKRMKILTKALPTEVQSGLDDTTTGALKHLGRELNRGIDKSSDWIRIRPGSASSSIVASKPSKGRSRGDAEAEIRVASPQSAVLKFGLAGETVRRPGDVGVGSRMLWIGQEKNLQDHQGIRLTPEGGLPKGTLKTLSKRAKRRGKRVPGSREDVFFGRPKGRTGRVLGFWQRPAERTHALRLLVAAVREIRYDGSRLVPFWNRGIEKGTDKAPARMERSVVDAVRAAVRSVRSR
jgi:hypothetical protein